MKIGKYPVKHTYSIPRLVADVLSLGIAVFIVSATIQFLRQYEAFLGSVALITDEARATMLANDPNYEWKQWLALIFPALMIAVFIVYIVLVLKSHKLARYNVTKRNAQQCCDAYTFCVSLVKLPALIIIADVMAVAHDKLLPRYGFGWFSWSALLYAVIFAIIIRYTMHRLSNITAEKPAANAESTGAVRIKAVLSDENKAESNTPDENNKEEV